MLFLLYIYIYVCVFHTINILHMRYLYYIILRLYYIIHYFYTIFSFKAFRGLRPQA